MHKVLSAIALIVALAPRAARAEEAPAPQPQQAPAPQQATAPQQAPAPQQPPAPKWYDTFEAHGLADAYYSANLNQKQSQANALHVFDAANGFQVSYAKLTAQLAPTTPYSVGFRADLGFGPTAGILGFSSAPSISSVTIQQAFVSLKLPYDLIIDGGKFVTNAGAEVIEAKDNWLYSRSLLFGFAIPFTHTGLRATLPIPGVNGLSAMAAVFNGWDNPPNPVGSEKMGHLALTYTGPHISTITINALYGRNPGETDNRLLLDGIVGLTFGDFSVNLNGDVGVLGDKSYWGLALMARYSFLSDKLRITARGEYFDNSDGVQTVLAGASNNANKYYEATLGLSIPVGSNAELRLEGRHDFIDSGDLPNGKDGQTLLQAAALAWF